MDARKGNIYEILNENKQFLIPVYQRYYSWDTEQCTRLWNDIVEMQKKCPINNKEVCALYKNSGHEIKFGNYYSTNFSR